MLWSNYQLRKAFQDFIDAIDILHTNHGTEITQVQYTKISQLLTEILYEGKYDNVEILKETLFKLQEISIRLEFLSVSEKKLFDLFEVEATKEINSYINTVNANNNLLARQQERCGDFLIVNVTNNNNNNNNMEDINIFTSSLSSKIASLTLLPTKKLTLMSVLNEAFFCYKKTMLTAVAMSSAGASYIGISVWNYYFGHLGRSVANDLHLKEGHVLPSLLLLSGTVMGAVAIGKAASKKIEFPKIPIFNFPKFSLFSSNENTEQTALLDDYRERQAINSEVHESGQRLRNK